MSKQYIEITQSFNAPVSTVFGTLTDHAAFGKLLKAKIRRVVDSPDTNKNGRGSVRRISAFPAPSFEETVVTFEPNQLMEYVISKGSPIKNHKGRMEFSEAHGKTLLNYTIEFEPKLPLPLLGPVLKLAVETPIRLGLKSLARQYKNQA